MFWEMADALSTAGAREPAEAHSEEPRLLMDVTSLVESNRRTGIERVMARLLCESLRAPEAPLTLPVRQMGADLFGATEILEELGVSDVPTRSGPVSPGPGDILFCGENKGDWVGWSGLVRAARARGARYVQVMYDLLPVRLPEFFPPRTAQWFTGWVRCVGSEADLILCDSRAVRDDLRSYLHEQQIEPRAPIGVLRLASDLGVGPGVDPRLRHRPRGDKRVLMVGTVEPRKGVGVLLDAAEALWRSGEPTEFVVLGRAGWGVSQLVERLERLNRSEPRFTWLRDASDLDLAWEYLNADLLVMASRGEGFGLPIVEALAHGVPVVARDLPVFRELLGDTGDYFILDGDLPSAIRNRLASSAPIACVPSQLVTWRETLADLLGAMASTFKR